MLDNLLTNEETTLGDRNLVLPRNAQNIITWIEHESNEEGFRKIRTR